MWTLNPWQTLLWIAALILILLPFVVAGTRLIVDAYFESKEKHLGRVMTALSNTINKIKEDALKELKEDKKNEG